MTIFKHSKKSCKLDGALLENMTNYDLKVSHSNPKDQKLNYEFGNDMNFKFMQMGRKNDRHKSLIKILKLPTIMATGILTIFLPSDPDELCDILSLLLQEKRAGNICFIVNEEIFAIDYKLLEYKCISKKQHKQNL